ncbi:MAG TPA: carboxypeptidase regulatory-like domain-containing protein [Pyrinomonadaceae bacterium]|nr:carboxypeptidase regulatory-like domain-containing protein [Pyrinomonadaceae bacterium]
MRKPILAFLLLTFCLVAVASGQGTTSRVTGIVQDANGAAIAAAMVTLTNEATGVSFNTETSDSGTYAFDLVQVGKYTVTVEKQGFKKFISQANPVNVNLPATINATLETGTVTETVTVQAGAEQVQTSTSGNIGSTIEQHTLESLPIVGTRGRNPLDLLNFQPGVVFGGNTGGAVNVNGSRDRAFNFTLDGIDINESTAGGSNFTPLRPNPDSVQEFQVVTSNFTAELGRSSGAQVTLVTRSGSNDFHGNVFEYYRTPRLDAKSYPVTIAGLPKDQFVQHIFGGSLGGPLYNPGFGEGTKGGWLRDKAFFFVNLQLLRAYDTALVTRTVYTQAARQGLFRYVVGRANAPVGGTTPASVDITGAPVLPNCNATASNSPCISSYNIATNPTGIGIDPFLSGLINEMPLPNNFTTGDGLNTAGFNFASPQHERQYDFVSKFDFNLRDNSLLYVRYAQGSQSSFGDSANGGRPIFPDSPNFVDTSRTPKNLAVNWRWSPTSTLTNEAIFGLSKFFFTFATPFPDPNLPFSFINVATANTNFSYNARGVRTLQYIDNATLIHGAHTLKGGINFRFNRHRDDRSNVAGSAIEPIVNFSRTAASFTGFNLPSSGSTSINSNDLTRLQNTIVDELGRLGSVSRAFVLDPSNPSTFAPAGTRWLNEANYTELDFYFQDNWRARSNLVFDLGVRWEPKLTPTVNGRPILVPNQPVKLGAPPSNTLRWVEGNLFDSDFSKILPSVGFAWDPFESGKTSIRGNYRIASDRIATFLFGSSIFQSTPGNNIAATNSTFGAAGGLYRNVGPVLAALTPPSTPDALRQPPAFSTNSGSVIDPDLQFPQVHEWSLSLQREIGNNVVEVNYIGKHAVHLLGAYNVNQVNIFASVPGVSEANFLDAFNKIRASSSYNSPLINLIMSGNAANNGGTARFRALNTTNITQGSVAAAALIVSQKTCASDDISAGICTSAQSGRRLLDLYGFPFLLQPYPQFTGGFNVFDSNDYSNYGGLQFIFKRRINAGLGFQFGYTFSKSKDNRSWDPSLSTVSTGSVQSASSTPFDLRDRNLNYTWSDFDRRHVFQGTYTYELPFGKGRKFLSRAPSIVDHIIGGWQMAGTVIWMSGRPFTVYSGINTVSNVVQSTADCNGCTRNSGQLVLESGRNFWFDAATRGQFAAPAPGSIGNTGRNFFLAPTYFQWDSSLSKRFRITERVGFDLRVDARNVLNNPSFDNPTAVITSTIFGRINDSVTNNARRIQLSGKLSF